MYWRVRAVAGLVVVAAVASACVGGSGDPAAPTTTESTEPPASTTTTAPVPLPIASATAEEMCASATLQAGSPGVASDVLEEISGVAASRQHDGVIWTHNDSGGAAQVHLIGSDGSDLGAWPLTDAVALDWEDMAIGPGSDGTDHLYLGDIGDNLEFRRTVTVYRAPEPADVSAPVALAAEKLSFAYPDGAHDAEALLVDPISRQIFIVTKFIDGSAPSLYAAPATVEPGETVELERVGDIDLSGVVSRSDRAARDEVGTRVPTAGAISADGTVVAMRTYNDVLLWSRDPAETLFEALSRPPCVAVSEDEKQGEAVAFLPDGRGYLTISEGKQAPIHRFIIPA